MTIFVFYPLFATIGIAFLKNYDYLKQSSDGFTWDNFGVVLGLVGFRQEGANIVTVYGANIPGASYMTDVIRYAIPNTLIIVFVTVPISTIIALFIAVGLNSIPWLKKSLQTIFFVPYVTNAIAVGMVFAVLFDYDGIINYLIGDMGHAWIDMGASQSRAMFALCIYIIWQALPFKILIFLSGLAGIDKQYYDAAKIDAASRWNTLSKITIPLLSPQILYVMITSFIGAFKEYTSVVGLIGRQGTSDGSKNMYTVVYYIYDTIGKNNVQYGAAAAVLLFLVILLFTALQFWISKKRIYY
jgi:multiple sugar transport system permease protein